MIARPCFCLCSNRLPLHSVCALDNGNFFRWSAIWAQFLMTMTALAPSDTSSSPKRKATLLVVDDEEGPRQSVRVIFKDEFEILMAADGPAAIEFAQKNKIDVAV